MKTVALISGGKDSCFNMMCCIAEGHEIVALANLRPEDSDKQELDSYMFQTVGHTAIDLYAEAMGLPLYVQTITGASLATGKDYRPHDGDEVEDLYKLLQAVKDDMNIEAVSVGAILSDYQRVRVENVCLAQHDKVFVAEMASVIHYTLPLPWFSPSHNLIKSHRFERAELHSQEQLALDLLSTKTVEELYKAYPAKNCGRLGLVALSFLWRRDQQELLQEMISCGIKAKIIKVAAMGLKPNEHLGLELSEILPHMLEMKSKYGLNVCGEGGEYETFVFDCPLFQQRININKSEQVIHSDDAFAPVGYLILRSCSLQPKPTWDASMLLQEQLLKLPLLTSGKYVEGLNLIEPSANLQAGAGDLSFPSNTKGGEGDPGRPTMIMCVPDMQLTGSESPEFKKDAKTFQVSGVRAVTGPDVDVVAATESAMISLKDCLSSHSITMEDIVSISLYVGDMSNYAAINKVYNSFYEINPPVRVCVEANLPRNVVLQLDCQGYLDREAGAEGGQGTQKDDRKVLHVQALSHWAPANIGPYSQAFMVDSKLYMAGIVPLVPATLQPVEGGITAQSSLALTHVQSVMSAIAPTCSLSCCPLVTCYVTRPEYIDICHQKWEQALKATRADDVLLEEKKTGVTPHVQYVQVSSLPKSCLVEWHVLAWSDIQEFEIQEIRQVKSGENHCIQAVSQYCVDNPRLFSCHISLEVANFESLERAEKIRLPSQMVDLFCQVWRQSFPSLKDNDVRAMPLVKVFFSPTIYDVSLLQKYFTRAIATTCCTHAVPEPALSLVPVSGLDSRKQILAWCQ